MSGDDERSWSDREKLSFSELDKRRKEKERYGERGPRGPGASARAEEAAKQYLKQIDGMFSSAKGSGEGARLAEAMRDARGTPGLAEACRAYRGEVGMPADPALLSLFLDAGEPQLVVEALEALRGAHAAGAEVGRGLRTQLRLLAQDPDNGVAEAAEELLEEI